MAVRKTTSEKQDKAVVVYMTKEQFNFLTREAGKRSMSLGALLKSSALERVTAQPVNFDGK